MTKSSLNFKRIVNFGEYTPVTEFCQRSDRQNVNLKVDFCGFLT